VREQAVSGGQIDHAPAAKDTSNAPRHLPRLVEFLARQTARVTHRARDPIEQRVARKAIEIAIGEAPFGGNRECHAEERARRLAPLLCFVRN
jgi:hypothetical protein